MNGEVDVAIVGGGLVGASLAIALEPLGLRVALVEGVAPQAASQPSFDDRTSALGNGTRRIFESLGVWAGMAAQAAPIRRIHVSDAGRFGFARLEAAEHGVEAFGYVITNRMIGAALRARLAALRGLELRMPAKVTGVVTGTEALELAVEPGTPLRARLVVAADGANSVVRAAAGLEARIEDYQQVAVVSHVRASRRSDGTAYERFTPTGPIAVLPLHDGALGVVWTLAPDRAQRVQALDDAAFLAELQRAVGWRLGRLQQVGQRQSYPLRLTRADTIVAPRTVLVGNAAQGLHPVAGQGFNLGLRDAVTLAEVLSEALAAQRMAAAGGTVGAGTAGAAADPSPFDCGGASVLEAYVARRQADRDGVTRFTDGLVKLFADRRPGFGAARDLGLLLFDLSPAAKSALSRISWGFAGRTPRLARGLGLEA